jgi:choice-of-anchor B domain-containing protein
MRFSVASLALAGVLLSAAGSASAAPVPCVNGFAGIYPCDKVDMLSKMQFTSIGGGSTDTGSDVWGWTDATTGREYAILALSNETAFVDMTDPVNPVYLGRLLAPSSSGACVPSFGPALPGDAPDHEGCPSPLPVPDDDFRAIATRPLTPPPVSLTCSNNSLWRDLEVYNDHVFIGSEQSNHGLVVFDLRQLRNVPNPPVTFAETARVCTYGNSHTTTINTTTGFLYANGANAGPCGGGGKPIIMDIRNPALPVFAGCNQAGGYTHDSQCFTYQGPDVAHQGASICINSNGVQGNGAANRLNIDDVTNPNNGTVRLSSNSYSGAGYTHQGWVTADQKYFLLDDELDEETFGGNTRTYVWNITDLDAPQLIGIHVGPTTAIDHQQFISGNFDYQSDYRAGLRILETKDVAQGVLTEVGFFDVYPPDNITDYGGTWAHYPFFHSGNVPITTIGPPYGSGTAEFFVLRPLFADLKATVTDAPDPVALGQNVTYTFTVVNQGPTYSSNTTLTDVLPATMTYVSATPSQGTCAGATTITCDLGRVEHDGTATVTIVARADATGTITNAGAASADENDTRPADNTATAQTTVTQAAQAAEPFALAVDAAGNGVFEPNEGTVAVAPTWRNIGSSAITLTGAATLFGGPAGPAYNTVDGSGAYPSLAPGATAPCSDCYGFAVTAATRPALHWDATFQETVSPSATAKTWVLHIGDSFPDVPATSGFYRFVETILHNGVTGGCTTTSYCPLASTTREQMAVFALVSKERAGYVPAPCSAAPMFTDVPQGSLYCRWIEELARRGVVSGCGGGNYCPTSPVTREQMAVFALKTLEGPAYAPPACGSAPYGDVTPASPFCPWIQELTVRGVVTGCGGGNYCPATAVSREQMSVFLSATFGLVLYGL